MTIPAAFDLVLASARVDPNSVTWESMSVFTVAIDGCRGRRTIRGRIATGTPESLRAGLANALRDYCAIGAAEIVGGVDA